MTQAVSTTPITGKNWASPNAWLRDLAQAANGRGDWESERHARAVLAVVDAAAETSDAGYAVPPTLLVALAGFERTH